MLTKDDIIFEEDLFAHSHIHSQEEVKEALVELIRTFVAELGIKRLDKVLVKKTDFFDTELGIANYKNYTIVLANNIAYCLADKNARFYQRSLAVLKHELYHFQDFQNLLLNRVLNRLPEINAEVLHNFRYWTEFFATYSTLDICEDENLYSSFRSVYEKSYSTQEEKKYYACRLMGYYLHKKHSNVCDELVEKHLSAEHLEKAKEVLLLGLNEYPYFSTESLKELDAIMDAIIIKNVEPPIYTPVSRAELLKELIKNRKAINKARRKL